MNDTVLSDLARDLITLSTDKQRIVVAVAGPPGSGKSTLAESLHAAVDAAAGRACSVIVPMDGFHYDNAILEPQGWLSRKGAPHTFDLDGYSRCIQSLTHVPATGHMDNSHVDNDSVFVPVFDRSLDLARASAREVKPAHTIVITEGNYLLLDQPGWGRLTALFDYRIYLDVNETVLEQRLIKRWLDHGLSESDAITRAESNDLPNARVVTQHRLAADQIIDGTIAHV